MSCEGGVGFVAMAVNIARWREWCEDKHDF
jgi:hypothetical protein